MSAISSLPSLDSHALQQKNTKQCNERSKGVAYLIGEHVEAIIFISEIGKQIGKQVVLLGKATICTLFNRVTPTSSPYTHPITELHFTLEDVNKLATLNLGLRHYTTIEEWESEAKHGMAEGCSLNLAPHLTLSPHDHSSRFRELIANPKVSTQEFVSEFEKGVDDFIDGSITHDLTQLFGTVVLNKTKMSHFHKFEKGCCFSLVSYQTRSARDFKIWGKGLGRIPKTDVSADKIVKVPLLDRVTLGIRDDDSVIATKKMGDEAFKRLVCIYRNNIIKTIRNYQRNDEECFLDQAEVFSKFIAKKS